MTDDLLTYRLDRLDTQNERIETRLATVHDDVLALKTKAAVWGAISGGVFSAIVAILAALVQRMR